MTDINKEAATMAALEQAQGALAKLPILGPALWLYARDPIKKFMFLGDIDWSVLPPIVLDQCRLYTKGGLPYAFVTWAWVNDTVSARLRGEQPRLAPHEWKCGEQVWIMDAVAPFGQLQETLLALRTTELAGKQVNALLPNPAQTGALQVVEWPAAPTI